MDYRTGKPIVVIKPRNPNVRYTSGHQEGLRLRVLDANHIGRLGERRLLVQKETADHPMHGLFSVLPSDVDPA
jgi:hypothetical protein